MASPSPAARAPRDRLSDLPDFLLGNILSYLPTKEAGCAAGLSRRWRNIFCNVHAISFEEREGERAKDWDTFYFEAEERKSWSGVILDDVCSALLCRRRTAGIHLRSLDYSGAAPAESLLSLHGAAGIPSCTVNFCQAPASESERDRFIIFMEKISAARHLHLHHQHLPYSCFEGFPSFSSLTRLALQGALLIPGVMRRILEQAPNLEILTLLMEFAAVPEGLAAPDESSFSVPCLRSRVKEINMVHYQGDALQRMMARLLFRNALVLERMCVVFVKGPFALQYRLKKEIEGWMVAGHVEKIQSTNLLSSMALSVEKTASGREYKVKDLSQADFGRLELELAEVEMPGLMACRAEFGPSQPFKGARISGSLHMTIQTAVLIETLTALGAERCLDWGAGGGPDLIVDDGGDATLLIHEGVKAEEEFERSGKVPDPDSTDNPEFKIVLTIIRDGLKTDARKYRKMKERLVGVSEETTTGVKRLYQMQESGTLLFPAINVNDSVTKSKFDNLYGCRHSLPDGLMRATDVMIAGKVAVVCGYGDVGKGCAAALKQAGARVIVTEIDPICALQALMEGIQILTLEDVVSDADIFVTTTGNKDIIMVDHMRKMKNNAIVCNIGHFDNEIDMNGLETYPGVKRITIKPQTDRWVFPETNTGIIVLAEGRLMNLGCATGHPSFVMSCSFTNQVIAQLELWKEKATGKYEKKVYVLPKHLDEKVAALHLGKLGARLTKLTKAQSEYISIPVDGPYKPAAYRY
ncbi:unnamed protein product [Triticum turgidum subsp. durum]|uniref:adenosylhomocysteinase n=1 Tax=Triticum turgidum subsp. durum TaxID=4567 RepID=A0A9R1P5W4_TRITD|nr:unnamed protein product [Triticum turgidum subsp. durum]